MTNNSVYNMFLFHRIDRDIYDRLISHGTTPVVARNVVALFFWLDNIGVNIIPYLRNNFNDAVTFIRLTAEAESILYCLRCNSPLPESALAIPIIASLTARSLDLDFLINFHRHEAAERITHTLAVGRLFFDDALFATFSYYEAAMEDARRRNATPPPMPAELARPFMPISVTASASADERSLIITFLSSSPLTEQEIIVHFQEQWGNCVERVAFEEMTSSSVHSCIRVVFKREGYVSLMLHDRVEFRFAINKKQVLAHRGSSR